MNINKDIKITLHDDECEAIRKVCTIVTEFADKKLCDGIEDCSDCPLTMFCLLTDQEKDFEEVLNDIANFN